jgi:hypothetical protein
MNEDDALFKNIKDDTITTSGVDHWSNTMTPSLSPLRNTTFGSGSTMIDNSVISNACLTIPKWEHTFNHGSFLNVNPSDRSGIHITGDAHFDGEITVQGVKLADRLNKIEERLAILRPNEKLEEQWNELKALGDRYRELERDIIEKEKIWDLLKK